jgi:branched-chain amino acid transport system permease protein
MAEAVGIRVNWMIAFTFGLAAALAGAAGLLLANTFFVSPTDGTNYIIKAYIAVTIGGWGSLAGAIAGAFLIALFEVIYPSIPLFLPLVDRNAPWAQDLFSHTVSTIILYAVVLVILSMSAGGGLELLGGVLWGIVYPLVTGGLLLSALYYRLRGIRL